MATLIGIPIAAGVVPVPACAGEEVLQWTAGVGFHKRVINLYGINETGIDFPGFQNAAGRVRVPIASEPGVRTAVIIADGQSNISSTVDQKYTPGPNVHNYSFYDGHCYRLADPVLGASARFGMGSWLGRLGDKMIAGGNWDRVIIAPMAIDGMAIAEWLTGRLKTRTPVMINRMRQAGLVPTHIIRMQGESDNDHNTNPADYTARLRAIVQIYRDNGIAAPFYVSRTTWISGSPRQSIRDAQAAAGSSALDIRLGPDTDALGNSYRHDNTHFNTAGGDAVSSLWAVSLLP